MKYNIIDLILSFECMNDLPAQNGTECFSLKFSKIKFFVVLFLSLQLYRVNIYQFKIKIAIQTYFLNFEFYRIHEKIMKLNKGKSGKLESLLLDIDKRYVSD